MTICLKPEILPIAVYENAISIYIDRLKKIDGVVSINMMGNINSPGLSDIDFLVVVDDNFSPFASSMLSVKDIDDRVFLHGPFIIPKSIANDLPWIIYTNNILNLYGENILPTFNSLNQNEKKLLSYCYLIDFSESRLQQFSDISENIEMRPWLTRVWSVIHSFYLVTEILEDFYLINDLEKDLKNVKMTREEWRKDGIVSDQIFLNSLDSAKKIFKNLFMKVLKKLYGDVHLEKTFTYYDGKKRIRFSSENSQPVYRQICFQLFGKKLYFYDVNQISNYAAHINMYFPEFKMSWSKPFSLPSGLEKAMIKRFSIVDKHNKWLAKHSAHAKSMSGYVGINTACSVGYRKRLEYLIGKIIIN